MDIGSYSLQSTDIGVIIIKNKQNFRSIIENIKMIVFPIVFFKKFPA